MPLDRVNSLKQGTLWFTPSTLSQSSTAGSLLPISIVTGFTCGSLVTVYSNAILTPGPENVLRLVFVILTFGRPEHPAPAEGATSPTLISLTVHSRLPPKAAGEQVLVSLISGFPGTLDVQPFGQEAPKNRHPVSAHPR